MTTSKNYHKTVFTKEYFDIPEEERLYYEKLLKRKDEEAIFVYNLRNKHMVYDDGWLNLLGLRKGEVNMLYLLDCIDHHFKDFVIAVTDNSLFYLSENRPNILDYSFTIEFKLIHQLSGEALPIRATIYSFEADDEGYLTAILGRFELDRTISFNKTTKYTVYSPDKLRYIKGIDNKLFESHHITYKELEVLKLISKGLAIKQVADELDVSNSAIEKRIYTLYKRFDVKSHAHLVSFCYKNLILPLEK